MLRVVRDLNQLIKNADERPFAVIIAKFSIRNVSDTFANDYFIIRKKKNWKVLRDYEIMNMDEATIRFFRQNLKLFNKVHQTEHGQVYELINKSFKNNKEQNGKSESSRTPAIVTKGGFS